jgi:hypothetical protein
MTEMATFAVDGKRQQMVATGVVEPVMEWVETAEGKRRPGDAQARQDGTGMPLWGVEVAYQTENWGRVSTVTVKVYTGHAQAPQDLPATPTGTPGGGLTVTAYAPFGPRVPTTRAGPVASQRAATESGPS